MNGPPDWTAFGVVIVLLAGLLLVAAVRGW
jgi:hypothetical protein